MNADSLSSLFPEDLLATLITVHESITDTVSDCIADVEQYLRHGARHLYETYASGCCSVPVQLEFSELQTSLLTVFVLIIVVNVLLIAFYWSKYGGVITDRFIRPSKSERFFGVYW